MLPAVAVHVFGRYLAVVRRLQVEFLYIYFIFFDPLSLCPCPRCHLGRAERPVPAPPPPRGSGAGGFVCHGREKAQAQAPRAAVNLKAHGTPAVSFKAPPTPAFAHPTPFSSRAMHSQTTYKLEPAGSHGVWGLDDFQFLCYYWGAAQHVGRGDGVAPAALADEARAKLQADDSLFFAAVQVSARVPHPASHGGGCPVAVVSLVSLADSFVFGFRGRANGLLLILIPFASVGSLTAFLFLFIFYFARQFVRAVKTGPFHEHSRYLFDISAVESWSKVNKGLKKMYVAEVLDKFPIVQHFLFGTLLGSEGLRAA